MTTQLPSTRAADAFVRGDPGGFSKVLMTTAARGALIGTALLICGERKRVVTKSLLAASLIELVVLSYAANGASNGKG